ncbi:MAG: hypothetical protein HRF49_09220 [bacterium]|jgi:hypothetical protein
MRPAILLALASGLLALTLPASAQTVSSGYSKLADGVYAFTADGGDAGVVVGCELGTDVKIIVSRNYGPLETYSVSEQLTLLGHTEQPLLVTAGFDKDGTPDALIMGIPAEQDAWPVFYKLRFAQDGITADSYPSKVIAGMFEEPGSWAELCPFYSRQETREGFSSLYQSAYVWTKGEGFAGLVWRENGIWEVRFEGADVTVDRIYAPLEGSTLAPVWSACRSPKGKLGALVAEVAPEVAAPPESGALPEPAEEEAATAEDTSPEEEIAPEEEAAGDEGTTPGGETESAGGGTAETGSEPADAGEAGVPAETAEPAGPAESAEHTDIIPAPKPEPRVKLVFVTKFDKDVRMTTAAKMANPPVFLASALAVDGRPFAYWITPTQKEGVYKAGYWGLSFLETAKIKPFELAPAAKTAPPFAAMRGLGLPALMTDNSGTVVTFLSDGKTPEWVMQNEYKPAGAAKGFGTAMGVGATAWFILDGSTLMWHWHKNK